MLYDAYVGNNIGNNQCTYDGNNIGRGSTKMLIPGDLGQTRIRVIEESMTETAQVRTGWFQSFVSKSDFPLAHFF